jgi:hypothetical protein
MIPRLRAHFQEHYSPARRSRRTAERGAKRVGVDMVRARARNQIPPRFDQAHGPSIDLPIALQALPDFAAAFHKCWRIQDDAIEAFVPRIGLLKKSKTSDGVNWQT